MRVNIYVPVARRMSCAATADPLNHLSYFSVYHFPVKTQAREFMSSGRDDSILRGLTPGCTTYYGLTLATNLFNLLK